jgi:ABC-type Zn uptake system ZnuABC Zn-binding protein ZnuA
MKLLALLSVLSLGGAVTPEPPRATVRVVTTIPDLADIAAEIGGDRIEVRSLAKGTMNIHAVPLKPSSLVAVNRADLFVQMGLSLEHAYVPGMLQKARNRRIQPGAPGFVDCSVGWEPIEVPETLSRSMGTDLHPLGNPHYNLDPRGGRHIAGRILAGLLAVDPEGEEHYTARHAAYLERLSEAEARWAALDAELRGRKLVAYHASFNYFLHHHGLELVGTVESKPGVPPTPRGLALIVEEMKREGVRVVLTAKWSNNKSVRFVAEKAGAAIIEAPTMVGGDPAAGSWIELMDLLHERLAGALGPR